MVMRIFVILGLIVLTAGFIFFAGNVIWLGTKEFFRLYKPNQATKQISSKENEEAKETTIESK